MAVERVIVGPPMQIALLDRPSDDEAKAVEVTWEELVKALHEVKYTKCIPCQGHDCAAKKGRGWIPARFVAPKRVDSNVAAITVAVFDLDAPTTEQLATVASALEGYSYVAHETHAGGSYRLAVALTEEVPANMWGDVWTRIVETFRIPADVTCRNVSHLYFTPTAPEGREFKVFDNVGQALNWKNLDPVFPGGAEAAVAAFKASVVATTKGSFDPTDAKNLRPAGSVDLAELRQAVTSMRRAESRSLLDDILGGRSLAEVGKRDTELNRACGLLATTPVGKPYPVETVIELMYGSIRAMDTEPEGLDHWLDLARQKYLRKVAERLERDARSDEDKAAILKVLGRAPDKVVEGTSDEWRKGLSYILNANGDPGGLRQTGANANLVLANDPNWRGVIRFNELSKELEFDGGPLAGVSNPSRHTEAANWLSRSEYGLHLRSNDVAEQMLAVGRKQGFDPIRDWLDSLQWDGKQRVDTFFEKYFQAKGDVEHLRAISRCFLIACVARIYQPGCEVHTVPILIGLQGAGKSRSLKALGEPWVADDPIDIQNKDARLAIASCWIVELAELSNIRGKDVDLVKNFISQPTDRLRPPYGRTVESFPRRSVFVGTTNEDEILTDWTGNRRWWPIKIGTCLVEEIRRDRGQLFAQAVTLYRAGTKWHLSPQEAERAETIARGFKPADIHAEQIVAWFAAKAPHERPKQLTTFDLLNQCCGVPAGQVGRVLQQQVGRAARSLGFTRAQVELADSRTWVYRTPLAILEMKRDARPSVVTAVPEESAK